MSGPDSERYWDERARENALYFVDNRLEYRNPDSEAFWRGGEEALDFILDAVGITIHPDETVVDIGCGVGRITRALSARAAQIVGVDVSSEMLDRAREANSHLVNVRWVHSDGWTLAGLPDGSADGCFSHVVFQHIPDRQVTLGYVAEMGRVLRPGGWAAFVLSTTPAVHRISRSGWVRGGLRALAGRGPRAQTDSSWVGSWVGTDALREAAAAAGIPVERLVYPDTQFTTVLCRRSP